MYFYKTVATHVEKYQLSFCQMNHDINRLNVTETFIDWTSWV